MKITAVKTDILKLFKMVSQPKTKIRKPLSKQFKMFSAGILLTTLSPFTVFCRCISFHCKNTHSTLQWNIMCLSGLGLAGCGGKESNHPHPPPLSRSSALLLVLLRLRSGVRHALREQLIQSGVTLTAPGGEDTPHILSIQPFTAGQMLQTFITARFHCQIPGTDPKHRFTSVPSPRQRLMQLRSYSFSVYSDIHEARASDKPVSGLTYKIRIMECGLWK